MAGFSGRTRLRDGRTSGYDGGNYVAGAKGIFEFMRVGEQKPGVLARLGPITNDAVGGLMVAC